MEPSVRNIEAGRVVWSIKYEKDSRGKKYLPSESQVISKINLRDKENARLVTVLKVQSNVNGEDVYIGSACCPILLCLYIITYCLK